MTFVFLSVTTIVRMYMQKKKLIDFVVQFMEVPSKSIKLKLQYIDKETSELKM
ncbi:hypothetical protein Sjap_005914 [Stephania japonica]|uniref:Uncharacterized protein n=1 Tax=Stephania japonica TaxID=461633 RepID=A0AAP0K4V6_9MAGN